MMHAPIQKISWTDDAKAELHLLGMNLHDLSVELSRQHPCASTILEGYAKRIDELMKRVPECREPPPPEDVRGVTKRGWGI